MVRALAKEGAHITPSEVSRDDVDDIRTLDHVVDRDDMRAISQARHRTRLAKPLGHGFAKFPGIYDGDSYLPLQGDVIGEIDALLGSAAEKASNTIPKRKPREVGW